MVALTSLCGDGRGRWSMQQRTTGSDLHRHSLAHAYLHTSRTGGNIHTSRTGGNITAHPATISPSPASG